MEVRVIAVIQARMGSSRFPGKMLAPFRDRPLICHALDYAARLPVDDVYLATSVRLENGPLALWAETKGAKVVRGPEDSVVTRFWYAAQDSGADLIYRICGGAPMMSLPLGHALLPCIGDEGYCGYMLQDGWPAIQTHLGLTPELFTRAELERVLERPTRDTHEHVTYEMYARGGAAMVPLPESLTEWCHSIDTPQQLAEVDAGGYRVADVRKPYTGHIYREGG